MLIAKNSNVQEEMRLASFPTGKLGEMSRGLIQTCSLKELRLWRA
jgi:hypothetical protein